MAAPKSLPLGCILRPATPEDLGAIRKLVFQAKLDPTQLRWENFSVIELQEQVIACGQLRQFSGCQELGSLVVKKPWRDRGLGSYLVEHLVSEAIAPVYVECMGWLVEFYEHLGFVKISWAELPKPLKIKFFLGQLVSKFLPLGVTILQAKLLKSPKS
ncbi:GNAT family N-acetyltransferase [Laspinema olomoucense]|uniref:GNAT family N-acetyltransferase n=1 Tax=Laspinema olomoucense D3b TaxID=2953688 RepID=A0ABT2NHU3_9CYAN|nr:MULTISPECIES: GNAT family N-acetyltransferase [unclassified Laspinema]MCT7975335.1 GNAT family N-acetyltransferase [Laspinema sp. D3d]MCT7980856.1 GNAT family N-acetyltransferase [Laspinema sp. D3b]MCT7988781.1 GNAT family N-acetyltransferase [Laspinema sp. D3a]MCT7995883.1 GNAT family N-acetyltransferase [Laspinema sp. D3c]